MVKIIDDLVLKKYFKVSPSSPYNSNSLELELKNSVANLQQKEEKFIINSDIIISKGDYLPYTLKVLDQEQKILYKINKMDFSIKDSIIYISEEIPNDTEIFLIPLVLEELSIIQHAPYFIQSFISADYNYLYIKYKHNIFTKFATLDGKLKKQETFDSLEIKDNYNYYKFKFPFSTKNDVNLFLQGKFHNLSSQSKSKIIKFFKLKRNNYYYKILYNDPDMIKMVEDSLGIDLPEGINFRSRPNLELITMK